MKINPNRIDEITLALLHMRQHGQRAWKSFDWETLNRLHKRGLISNPRQKSHSVILSAEAEELAERLFEEWFMIADDADPEGLPWEYHRFRVSLVTPDGEELDPPAQRVFLMRATNVTFADLHITIRDACPYEGGVGYEFRRTVTGPALCEGEAAGEILLSGGFEQPGDAIYYRYDTRGARWLHRVELVETIESTASYFRRLEEVEGVFPYERFESFNEFMRARATAFDGEASDLHEDLVDHVRLGIVFEGLASSFNTGRRVYEESLADEASEIEEPLPTEYVEL